MLLFYPKKHLQNKANIFLYFDNLVEPLCCINSLLSEGPKTRSLSLSLYLSLSLARSLSLLRYKDACNNYII